MNAMTGGADCRSSQSQPSTSPPESSSESEELQRVAYAPAMRKTRKTFMKQLSMRETKRELNWEKRRRQIMRQERERNCGILYSENCLTDEDFNELKASIELGFGFNEEGRQQLCNTLPALDLYFAVNRQVCPTSPSSSPLSHASSTCSFAEFGSPKSEDSWKICSPGESPQQVKTRLRHWAQAVACSVMQCT